MRPLLLAVFLVSPVLSQTSDNLFTVLPNGTKTVVGEIRWRDLGTHYVGLKSATSVAANIVWTMPSVDGSAGNCWGWASATTLGWVACSGSTTVSNGFVVTNQTNVGPPVTTMGLQEYYDPTGHISYINSYGTGASTAPLRITANDTTFVGPGNFTDGVLLSSASTSQIMAGSRLEVRTGSAVEFFSGNTLTMDSGSTLALGFAASGATQCLQSGPAGVVAGSGSPCGLASPPITLSYTSGLAALTITGGAFIQSFGGFLSSVTGGVYNAFQSESDGAFLRGYALDQNISGTAGGYFDIAPITYSPSPGFSCFDEFGNEVNQPSPLFSGTFGVDDVVAWNSTSPLQGYHAPFTVVGGINYYKTGTPCAAPIPTPVGLPNGLNLNTYVFARGGLATSVEAYNAIQAFDGGGVTAQALTAAGVYPAGTQLRSGFTVNPFDHHTTIDGSFRISNQFGTSLGGYVYTGYSDQNPGGPSGTCTSISVCDNPFIVGFGLEPGEISYNTSVGSEVVYDGSSWRTFVLTNSAPTLSGLQVTGGNFQVDGSGNISAAGVATANGGVFTSNTAFNSIHTNGGIQANLGYTTGQALYPQSMSCPSLNSPAPGFGGWGYQGGSVFCYYNSGWHTVDLSVTGSGVTSIFAGTGIGVSSSTGAVTVSNVGVTSLGGSTGAVSLFGGSGVTIVGTTISIGQPVGTSNSPTFSGLVTPGAVLATGAAGSGSGFAVVSNTQYNSFQTPGGFYSGGSSNTGYAFTVGGSGIINNLGQFVGNGIITTSGISASGYNISGGFFGQTVTVVGSFTCNGGACTTLQYRGGVLTNYF